MALMTSPELKSNFNKNIKLFLKLVLIASSVNAVAQAYNLWKLYGRHPKVKLISVDYRKGEATIEVNGKTVQIYYGSPFYIGDYWSVQMKTMEADKIDRIEVLKQGNVIDYIK
jgi:hypothetical protein